MLKENEYTRIVNKYSNEELIHTLHEHEKYVDGLLQAVIWECEVRNISDPLIQVIEPTLKIDEPELIVEETQPITEEIYVPKPEPARVPYPLYSQTAILAFSVFFSTFLGGILFIINLYKVDKKGILPAAAFCIIYSVAISYAFEATSQIMLMLVMNIAGGLILSEVMWNKYIGKGKAYKHKSTTVIFIILFIVCIIVSWYVYTNYPEYFNIDTAELPKK